MGLREDFLAKFARLQAGEEARQASLETGRPAKVLAEAELIVIRDYYGAPASEAAAPFTSNA